jgi:putative Mg2+ transporter-C (MgtC) family protein
MIDTHEMIVRLLLGAFFGGVIGYERQAHGRAAGFRTNLIVCLSTVLIMEVSLYYHHLSTYDPSFVRVDPSRIAQGAITGMGFLGAGVIIKLGPTVQGLTTAATLWMVAVLGLALGSGMYEIATAGFGVTLFALVLMGYLESLIPWTAFRTLTIVADTHTDEDRIRDVLAEHHASVHHANYERDTDKAEMTIRYTIHLRRAKRDRMPFRSIVDGVAFVSGVRKVSLGS